MTQVPVTITSGATGSGKTALPDDRPAQPGLADGAFITHAPGEVGIDRARVRACAGEGVLSDAVGDRRSVTVRADPVVPGKRSTVVNLGNGA